MFLSSRTLVSTFACGALLLCGLPNVYAQGMMGGPPPPGMHGPMHGGMGMMAQMLNLTPAQQAKLKPIMAAQRAQMRALFSNPKLSQTQKMQKMQAMRQTYQPKINAVLTPAQRAKMASMMMHWHGGHPGGPGGPPR